MMAPAHLFALWATRYMAEAGVQEAQLRDALSSIAIDQRRYAAGHPGAMLGSKPLDAEGFAQARMIAWPLSLFMICLENDGACAVVMTTAERARELGIRSAPVLATSQSLAPDHEPMSMYAEDLLEIFPRSRAHALWADAGVGPRDVSVAELYDASSLMTLLSLELYGFVERGRAWEYVTRHGIGPDSPLPINTHGGHLADGYVQGMTGLVEAVRQVRGDADNQVPQVAVSFFGGVSGGAVVLATDEVVARVTEEAA
jgi:acetyl-CoA acetyltransferase